MHIWSQLDEIVWRSRLLCYQTTMTLFSSKRECLFSSLFVCSPFPFPQGGVAFTASNYRLYLSHISPYISADLSRPLQGQLIALWQACARPLKEKSRSGWSNSVLCSSSKHLHIRLPRPYLSALSFCHSYHFMLLCFSLPGIPLTTVSLHLSFHWTKKNNTYFCLQAFCLCAHDTND